MAEEEQKYESNVESKTGGGPDKPTKAEISSTDVKLGQLEVSLAALKEKIDGERTLKLWVVGTVIAIAAGVIGGLTFYHTLTEGYLDTYTKLQDKYYQDLLTNSTNSQKVESCSNVAAYYSQFKDCLSK